MKRIKSINAGLSSKSKEYIQSFLDNGYKIVKDEHKNDTAFLTGPNKNIELSKINLSSESTGLHIRLEEFLQVTFKVNDNLMVYFPGLSSDEKNTIWSVKEINEKIQEVIKSQIL